MTAADETVVHVTPDAAWLPRHGRADVIRRSAPPAPMCVARLLLRQDGRVFCVLRPDTGLLDLPMHLIEPDDPTGMVGVAGLAQRITGHAADLTFVGAVRNVVDSPADGYDWPTPLAHFGVWTSTRPPVVDGTWVSIGGDSVLRDRHWYPLAR